MSMQINLAQKFATPAMTASAILLWSATTNAQITAIALQQQNGDEISTLSINECAEILTTEVRERGLTEPESTSV